MQSNGESFQEIYNTIAEIIDSEDVEKQAAEDSTVLNRTEPKESGSVPTYTSDINEKELRGLYDYVRALVEKKDPSAKTSDGSDKQKGVNEPGQPPKQEALGSEDKEAAGIEKIKNILRSLKNEGEETQKKAGGDDVDKFVAKITALAKEGKGENPTEGEVKEAAQVLAELIALTDKAGETEQFIADVKDGEEKKAQQDYAIGHLIGTALKQAKTENDSLIEKNASIQKELDEKKEELEKKAGETPNFDNLSPYALEQAKASYKQALEDEQLAKKAGINLEMLKTIELIQRAGGLDFLKSQALDKE